MTKSFNEGYKQGLKDSAAKVRSFIEPSTTIRIISRPVGPFEGYNDPNGPLLEKIASAIEEGE